MKRRLTFEFHYAVETDPSSDAFGLYDLVGWPQWPSWSDEEFERRDEALAPVVEARLRTMDALVPQQGDRDDE